MIGSCGALPSLFGSEDSGDHSKKTRDAGGTCRAGHAAASHQSECTCCVVGWICSFSVSKRVHDEHGARPHAHIADNSMSLKRHSMPEASRMKLQFVQYQLYIYRISTEVK